MPLIQQVHHFLRACRLSYGIERGDELYVGLPENPGQPDFVWHNHVPLVGLEGELLYLAAFSDRRKLKKVASDHELQPSERPLVASN